MSSLKIALLGLVLLAGSSLSAGAQLESANDNVYIKLWVGRHAACGAFEIGRMMEDGATRAQLKAAFPNDCVVRVKRGQRAILTIRVFDASGRQLAQTGDQRLHLEHFGCLTIAPNGLMTVRPNNVSEQCRSPEAPSLMIAFMADDGRSALSLQSYQFEIAK